MDHIVPWGDLCALIAPMYPKAGDGRPPKELGSLEQARPLMDVSMLLICGADKGNVQRTPRSGGGAVEMLTGKANRGKHGD